MYNDKLDPDRQITEEEKISALIFDKMRMYGVHDDNVGEETCNRLGREILHQVLSEFCPEFID